MGGSNTNWNKVFWMILILFVLLMAISLQLVSDTP